MQQIKFKEETGGELSVALTRHRVTCGSKPGVEGFFPFFGPFLLHVICPKVLVQKFIQSLYIF